MSQDDLKLKDLEYAEYVDFPIVTEKNTLIYKLPFPCLVMSMRYYNLTLIDKSQSDNLNWDYELLNDKIIFSADFIDMIDEGDMVWVYAIKKSPINSGQKSGCQHLRKYVNKAGFKSFWVCPDCKKDLGDCENI